MRFTAYVTAATICAANNGITFDPRTGEINPSSGFALSEHPEAERVLHAAPSADDLAGYFIRNARLFIGPDGEHTGAYIGAWHDSESGKWFIDTVTVVADRAEAIRRGRAAAQIAIWDLAKKEEIRLA